MTSSQIGIVFEQLDNPTIKITSIDEFIRMHNGLRQLSSRMVSFEGAEEPNSPLKFVWVDNQKYPRYNVYINLQVPTELKELNMFLDRKKFYWMISSVSIYADPNNLLYATTKCRHFFEDHYELIWKMATTQMLALNGIHPNVVQNGAAPSSSSSSIANNPLPPPAPEPNFVSTSICRVSKDPAQ